MDSFARRTLSRRAVIRGGVTAGLVAALGTVSLAHADEATTLPLITKVIPSSGEKIPVVGLGTNAYSVTSPDEIAARREVLQRFPTLGAKIIDTAYGYGEAEVVIGRLLGELGTRNQIFLATKTPNKSSETTNAPIGIGISGISVILSRSRPVLSCRNSRSVSASSTISRPIC